MLRDCEVPVKKRAAFATKVVCIEGDNCYLGRELERG
jgi:hypothetical protein